VILGRRHHRDLLCPAGGRGINTDGDGRTESRNREQGSILLSYSDRGSHFWLTPKAGGKVDTHRLAQVGRALKELGIQMFPVYSPQARGRSERSFGALQGRLPHELRLRGIGTLEADNDFLRRH
jgi:hypothetical protein